MSGPGAGGRVPATDANVEELAEALLHEGYVVVEGALSPDDVATKRAALAGVLDEIPFGANSFLGHRTRRAYMLLAKTRAFDNAVLHPLLLGVLDRVLTRYQLSVCTAIEIHPGEVAQTLHTDQSAYPLPPDIGPLVVNSMWAMDDFTEANGATRLVPRSHLGVPDDPPAAGAIEVQGEMPAGSVLIYLGNLVHGGGANATDRPRLGVVAEFAASWLRPQENLGLAYPPELVEGLPERLQELLGYNLYPPFVGYVDGLHPLEWLRQRGDR